MSHLLMVSGAPGSGKSTLVPRLAAANAGIVVLDVDDLLDRGRRVLGVKIAYSDAAAVWPEYNKLWMTNLALILRSGVPALYFSPLHPHEVQAALPMEFRYAISWALLDCSDAERTRRLHERGWSPEQIRDAIEDAAELRSAIPTAIHNDTDDPDLVAGALLTWAKEILHPAD